MEQDINQLPNDMQSSGSESSTLIISDDDCDENDQETSCSEEEINKEETKKARVPSALTIENLRRYEEETDPVDVEELMAKVSSGEIQCKESDITIQEHPIYESPAVRTTTRGLKITGEEYVAISVDVQTDESWLYQSRSSPDQMTQRFPSQPFDAVAAADLSPSDIEPLLRRKKAEVLQNLSTSDLIIPMDTEVPHVEEPAPRPTSQKQAESPTQIKSPTPAIVSEAAADYNPVTELVVVGSEYDESRSETTIVASSDVSSVGLPKILQYKPESKHPLLDFSKLEEMIPKDLQWDDLSDEQKVYYQSILDDIEQQRILIEEQNNSLGRLINIEPHTTFGSQQEKKLAKEQAERQKVKEQVERQKTLTNNQTSFYAFARQLKTVNYALSSDKCMEEGWTLRPASPPAASESTNEMFVEDLADIVSGKRYHKSFVRKYYDNGRIFLAVFSNGSGTVWYPSGNIAISIVSSDKYRKVEYVLHEDKHPEEQPIVQAVFGPNGKCACYYPTGKLRVILTAFGGEYFNEFGERIKRWKWRDPETHVHAPPFQPITFGVSKQTGVRIISQESIYVTFMDGKRSVRFNVGTRLKLKQNVRKLEPIDMDAVLLHEKVAYIQSIIERIQFTIKFPNSPRLAKLKLPMYLNTKLERAAQLRAAVNGNHIKAAKPDKRLLRKSGNSKQNAEHKKLPMKLKKIPQVSAEPTVCLPSVSVVVN